MTVDHATILAALSAYTQYLRASGRKPYTVEVYQRCIVSMCTKMSFVNFDNITPEKIREYFIDLRRDHKPGGVWIYYRAIKAFLRWYWSEMEPEQRNPIDFVKLSPVQVKAKKGVPLEDYERLLEVCKLPRDKAILQCLLDSGCRASEFCNLSVSDVNMLTGQVWVKSGKGDKPRIVRFGDKARRALRRYLKDREVTSNSPLFATDEEERFNRNSLHLLVKRRSEDAGIPCPGLHDFRRLCGYLMHKNGASVREIQIYLGHSSMVVTQRYIALDDDDIMDAHRRTSPVDNLRL